MSTRSTFAAVCAVSVMGASLAACGGGSSGLSRTDLATKANAICKEFNDKADAVPQPTSIQDASDAAAYFDKIVPIINAGQGQLAALKPDSAAKTDWNAFVTAEGKTVTLLKSVDTKADNADPSGLTDLQSQAPPLAAAVKAAATKIGATNCGQ